MNWPENRYDSDGWRCQWVSSGHQQVGPAQQRRFGRGAAADGDVVAAAGAPVAAVDGERLGAQPALPGLFVQRAGDRRPARPSSPAAGC